DVGGQESRDDENALLRNGFETRVGLATKSPDHAAAQIQDVVGALPERRVLESLELPMPAHEDPPHGRFRGQQRAAELSLEFSGGEQLAKQLAVGAEDSGECRIELSFDALGVSIEFRQRLFEGVRESSQLVVDLARADRLQRAAALEH